MTLVPHTTSVRDTRFEVAIPVQFLKPGAFDAQGLVTVSVTWLVRKIGSLSPGEMQQVEAGVCDWLGIAQGA